MLFFFLYLKFILHLLSMILKPKNYHYHTNTMAHKLHTMNLSYNYKELLYFEIVCSCCIACRKSSQLQSKNLSQQFHLKFMGYAILPHFSQQQTQINRLLLTIQTNYFNEWVCLCWFLTQSI